MNVTELARKLKIPTKELRQVLPKFGFDIGLKAIKVDDRVAKKIIKDWPMLRKKLKEEEEKEKEEKEKKEEKKERKAVIIPPFITVRDLAYLIELPVTRVIEELMKNGIFVSLNEKIDYETAAIVAEDLGIKVTQGIVDSSEEKEIRDLNKLKDLLKEDEGKAKPRPPVIVVMGHVDHGKTKLLDTIRKTNVIEEESGGITQHIGAYQVKKSGKIVTFIDTPGHEAFTAMRSRGAKVADIAILVVAADDGVKPQTIEATKIIEQAKIPMIVAINKIDKPEADIERTKRELSEQNIIPEDWGGKAICVPISAKIGEGIDNLLEMIFLVADMEKEKITANPERTAAGTIIESRIDKGEGPVATLLVQAGTLKERDFIAIDNTLYGKVRAMKNFQGKFIKEAPPSMPVRILGLRAAPKVGDILEVTQDIKSLEKKIKMLQIRARPFPKKKGKREIKKLNLILKADVTGSIEAISEALEKMEYPEVRIQIIEKGLGNITETDMLHAKESDAYLMGFHVIATPTAQAIANEKNIEYKTYKVIYELFDDVKEKLEKLLEIEIIRQDLGQVKVLAIFRTEKNSMIIGGKVMSGKVEGGAKIKVIRKGEEVTQGNLKELQIAKQNVREVGEGQECGINFEGPPVIEVGDILEIYKEEKKERRLG